MPITANKKFVEDGYLLGALRPRIGKCPMCHHPGNRVIDIADVTLPPTFTVEATILWDKKTNTLRRAIGLTCGCYAKFHRQCAHICDSQLSAGRAV